MIEATHLPVITLYKFSGPLMQKECRHKETDLSVRAIYSPSWYHPAVRHSQFTIRRVVRPLFSPSFQVQSWKERKHIALPYFPLLLFGTYSGTTPPILRIPAFKRSFSSSCSRMKSTVFFRTRPSDRPWPSRPGTISVRRSKPSRMACRRFCSVERAGGQSWEATSTQE